MVVHLTLEGRIIASDLLQRQDSVVIALDTQIRLVEHVAKIYKLMPKDIWFNSIIEVFSYLLFCLKAEDLCTAGVSTNTCTDVSSNDIVHPWVRVSSEDMKKRVSFTLLPVRCLDIPDDLKDTPASQLEAIIQAAWILLIPDCKISIAFVL